MSFNFVYLNTEGNESESSLLNLVRVVEGPVDLGGGWTGDRVNYDKVKKCFIEFRSGKEMLPGFTDTTNREVDIHYVCKVYKVSKGSIMKTIGSQDNYP